MFTYVTMFTYVSYSFAKPYSPSTVTFSVISKDVLTLCWCSAKAILSLILVLKTFLNERWSFQNITIQYFASIILSYKTPPIFNLYLTAFIFFDYFDQLTNLASLKNCACNGIIISSAAVNELIVKSPKDGGLNNYIIKNLFISSINSLKYILFLVQNSFDFCSR
jgi:hypothetical protein